METNPGDPVGPRASDGQSGSCKADEIFEEYAARINAGEGVDYDEIRSAYPEFASALIEDLELFKGLGSEAAVPEALGVLGDYTLQRQIGRGGMGVVYDAWQNSVGRRVALKMLPAGVARETRSVTRFIREAKTAAQLNHPSVVSVFGMGVEAGTPYFAMEFVAGKTLAQMLKKIKEAEDGAETVFGDQSAAGYFEKIGKTFADVAEGLAHAHSKGVIHRDIKPSNLILDREGRLRILDFGLARLEGQESLTISGDVVGTPSYMSPEQARAKKIPIDHRSDVYSLGATLYETLTGQPPFSGKDHADTISQIIGRDPIEPRNVNPRVPKDLETVVLKCLRKDANDRYGTAEALAQDLRRFVRGEAVEARPEASWQRLARNVRLYRRTLLATAAASLLVVVGLIVANGVVARARDQARYDHYVTAVRLAGEDWRTGNFIRFTELLREQIPQSNTALDFRGWEWHYLDSLRGGELLSMEATDPRQVAWSSDGQRLAAGSTDGIVRIWRVSPAGERAELEHALRHEGKLAAIAWEPSGERLAVGLKTGVVTLWDLAADERLDLAGHREQRLALALDWSRDGRLAVGCRSGAVLVWNADTGELERSFDLANFESFYRLWSLALCPDGRQIAFGIQTVGQGGQILVGETDGADFQRISAHRFLVKALSWSPDGGRLASGGYGGAVTIWNAESWNEHVLLDGHDGIVYSLAFGADGKKLASGGADSAVKIWSVEADEAPLVFRGHTGQVRSVAWHPNLRLLASGSSDGSVKLWDPAREPDAIVLKDLADPFVFSPDGQFIAGNKDLRTGLVRILDTSTFEELQTLDTAGEWPPTLTFSPDTRFLAVGSQTTGDVVIWDWRQGVVERRFQAHKRTRSIDWHPGGRVLATGGRDGRGRIWDAETGRKLCDLPMDSEVLSVLWSPNGALLATAGYRQEVIVWNGHGRVVKRLDRHPGQHTEGMQGQYSLAWSPGGERLAAVSSEGALVVWETRGWMEIVRERGHLSQARCIDWSPDGRRLVTGGEDGNVKVWDAITGEELLTLYGPRLIYSVAWTPDGRRFAATHEDGIRVYEAPGYESGHPEK